jgi:hypothetical protein
MRQCNAAPAVSVVIEVQNAKGVARQIGSTTRNRAKPGEKPERTIKTTGIMTATGGAINDKTCEVSLALLDGKIMNRTVGPQVKRLEHVRKGDEVVMQYSTIVSISVKTP